MLLKQEQTSAKLKNLLPDSQYFLQVQAISLYGDFRIKGDKASKLLNTTFNSDIKTKNKEKNPLVLKTNYYYLHGKRYAIINWNKRSDEEPTK